MSQFDYAFGQLNKLDQSRGFDKRPLDTRNSSFLNEVSKGIINQYKEDYLSGRVEFLAVVLHPDWGSLSKSSVSKDNILDILNFAQKDISVLQVKCRIPEIHAALPVPADSEDLSIIGMYPTFESSIIGMPPPSPGDIVRVTFKNMESFEGPVYLGPYSAPHTTNGEQTTPAFRNSPQNVTSAVNINAGGGSEGKLVRVVGFDPERPQKAGNALLRDDAASALETVAGILKQYGIPLHLNGGYSGGYRGGQSFHNLALAFDLNIEAGSGFHDPNVEPYVITIDKMLETKRGSVHLWRLYGRSTVDSHSDANVLEGCYGGASLKQKVVKGNFIDITSILEQHGFSRIPAWAGYSCKPDGSRVYLNSEWWHYQYIAGVEPGQTYGELCRKVNNSDPKVLSSFGHLKYNPRSGWFSK